LIAGLAHLSSSALISAGVPAHTRGVMMMAMMTRALCQRLHETQAYAKQAEVVNARHIAGSVQHFC
jgi:hypothetical protein